MFRNSLRAAALACLPLFAACADAGTPLAPAAGAPAAALAVSEDVGVQIAVFEELVDLVGRTDVAAHCFGLGDAANRTDPGPIVLNHFAANVPPVVPQSDCTTDVSGTYYVPTGERAQGFYVESIEYASARAATAVASWHLTGRAAGGYTCDLRKRGSSWAVASCTATWIA